MFTCKTKELLKALQFVKSGSKSCNRVAFQVSNNTLIVSANNSELMCSQTIRGLNKCEDDFWVTLNAARVNHVDYDNTETTLDFDFQSLKINGEKIWIEPVYRNNFIPVEGQVIHVPLKGLKKAISQLRTISKDKSFPFLILSDCVNNFMKVSALNKSEFAVVEIIAYHGLCQSMKRVLLTADVIATINKFSECNLALTIGSGDCSIETSSQKIQFRQPPSVPDFIHRLTQQKNTPDKFSISRFKLLTSVNKMIDYVSKPPYVYLLTNKNHLYLYFTEDVENDPLLQRIPIEPLSEASERPLYAFVDLHKLQQICKNISGDITVSFTGNSTEKLTEKIIKFSSDKYEHWLMPCKPATR